MRQLRFLIKIDELMSLAVKRSYVVYESYRNIYCKVSPHRESFAIQKFCGAFSKATVSPI